MADPATSPDATPDRRDRRRDRNRRRVRRIFTGVAGVAVVVFAVLIATDAVRFGGDDRPSLAGTVRSVGRTGTSAAPTTTGPRNCRPLSSADPLRLWVGGDSLSGSLGPALGKVAGATGVVQPYFDSRVSSGLGNPGFFDWPDHAASEMTRLEPEIVVFFIGTNDFSVVSGDWKENYATRVDEMMRTLVAPGRTVYWLGAPTLKDDDKERNVVEVNAIFQDVAKRHRDVHYVDAHQLFADAEGKYAADLPNASGELVTVRTGDGVHLTPAGAEHVADAVYKLVDAQCAITEQKVDGIVLPTIETPGSTKVAPSSGASGSGSSGGSIQTTPPASAPTTAPPVTAPPATTAPATTAPATTAPTTPTTTAGGTSSE